MIGAQEVIRSLQAAVPLEAQLNLQYRLDERKFKFLGLKKLSCKLHLFGSDAHGWLKAITTRLLLMSGDQPSVSYTPGRIADPDNPTLTLQAALDMESAIVKQYEGFIPICAQSYDDGTRNLFEHLVKWHEHHIGWLERQLRLIKYIGESEYYSEKL